MSLVDGGRIVCSKATGHLAQAGLPEDLRLIPVGTVQLKGLSTPEEVFAVGGPGLGEMGTTVVRRPSFTPILPPRMTQLIGRANEVAMVAEALSSGCVVTLTGFGGIGKTRLALEVASTSADRFGDGVAWVDLASLLDVNDVAQVTADALGIASAGAADVVERIMESLAGRRVLIVFDNCEHLRREVASVVVRLLSGLPGVVILATSRERLGVDAERVVAVGPLRADSDDSPAVEVVIERMGSTFDDLDTSDLDAVARLATRLEGVPLALELAAARCRSLGPAEVERRLRSEFRLLADPDRTLERHRTLDAALEWSYGLLSESEQAALAQASVFAGSFSLDGAEAVLSGTAAEVDIAVASLVDKSLVHRQGRWLRLLETTRQFAGAQLDRSDLRDHATQAHTRYVVREVEATHDRLQGRDEALWVDYLDVLWPDVRQAVRRCFDLGDADSAISMVVHLAVEGFWRRPEVFGWAAEAFERYGHRSGHRQADLFGAAALAAFLRPDPVTALRLAEEGLALQERPGRHGELAPRACGNGDLHLFGQPTDRRRAPARSERERGAGCVDASDEPDHDRSRHDCGWGAARRHSPRDRRGAPSE